LKLYTINTSKEFRIITIPATNIIRKKDIVRFVKARRRSWIGHVERMEDSRMPKRLMRGKIYTRRKADQRLDGKMTFKRTDERWGLKDGEGKLRIETSGGE
jgi:hypothetical protein